MQTQLFGEQLTFATIFSPEPPPTAAAAFEATQEWNDIALEIEEKRERIVELKKEIGDDEEEILREEEDDLDVEPDEGEECIFNTLVPQLEADIGYLRAENDAEIRELEEEIEGLEGKLTHG